VEESQEELRRLDGVSELIALSLATSGFISIKSIATADTESLKTVPGVEEELHGEEEPKLTAAALKGVAENYVAAAEARGEALRPATLTEIRAAADAAAAEAAAVEAAAVEAAAVEAAAVEPAAVEPAAAEPAAAEPATETEAPATDAAGGSGPDDESSAADEAELASLAPAGASGSGASGSGGEESGEEETQAQDDPIVTLKEGNEIE